MLYASGSHDGYRRLHGSPVHRRRIETKERSLRVSDTVSGSGVHQAIGYFHFHPDVQLEEGAEGGWNARLPDGTTLHIVGQDGLRLARQEGKYAPEFGKVVARSVLAWRVQRDLPITAGVEIFEEE